MEFWTNGKHLVAGQAKSNSGAASSTTKQLGAVELVLVVQRPNLSALNG